jgi:hypothetical protein
MLKTLTAAAVIWMIGSSPAKAQLTPNLDLEYTPISQTTIPNARHPRKHVNPIKLTVRNLPIHRIFADDDGDDNFSATQYAMNHRREIGPDLVVVVSEPLSDSVALRLWLIRHRALEVYERIWG